MATIDEGGGGGLVNQCKCVCRGVQRSNEDSHRARNNILLRERHLGCAVAAVKFV
jgi:hypothetical protein